MPFSLERIMQLVRRTRERVILVSEMNNDAVVVLPLEEYERQQLSVPSGSAVQEHLVDVDASAPAASSVASLPTTVSSAPRPASAEPTDGVEELSEEEMFAHINATIARWEAAQEAKKGLSGALATSPEKTLQFKEGWMHNPRLLKEEDLKDVPHQQEDFY